MNRKIFNIKPNHEIVEFIRREISKSGDMDIAIAGITIDNYNLGSRDIYGFDFNANNTGSTCINCSYYGSRKVDNPPLRVESLSLTEEKLRGYDYYEYSCNATIKLSSFLSKNPQYSNMEEWTDKIEQERVKCKYDGHNTDQRRVSIKMPDNSREDVKFPDNVDSNSILTWIKPIEDSMTTEYYREISLDEVFNIKRNRVIWIDGLWFFYNYKDGCVEIFDITNHSNSILSKGLFSLGLINRESLNSNTKIISEIEKSLFEVYDREFKVKEIKIVNGNR